MNGVTAAFPGEDPGSRVRRYLRPGESLIWSGRPDPTVTFSPADAFLVPFSVMWGGFAVFWEGAVLSSGGSPFFVLWGIPFVGIGLYFIFGRFIVKRRRKLRTVYGLSTERAIVVVGDAQVTDAPVRNQAVSMRRSRDGSHGSVEFGSHGQRWGSGLYANTGMEFFGRSWGGPTVGFYDVDNFEVLRRAVDQARGE